MKLHTSGGAEGWQGYRMPGKPDMSRRFAFNFRPRFQLSLLPTPLYTIATPMFQPVAFIKKRKFVIFGGVWGKKKNCCLRSGSDFVFN